MKLLEHFKELSLYPKNAEELKGLILQLAVQGKLTANWREENPNNEAASELLKKIEEDKAQHTKKRSLTTKGEIEEPYILPKSWSWTNGSQIFRFEQGIQIDKNKQFTTKEDDLVRFLRIVDFTQENEDLRYVKSPGDKYFINERDIVMVRYGTVGHVGTNKRGILANNLFKIHYSLLNKEYCILYFKSPLFLEALGENTKGSTMPSISFKFMNSNVVPLPPLEEQKAIVEVVNTLFAEVEQLEALTKERIELKESFVVSGLTRLTEAKSTLQEWNFLQQHFSSFFTEKKNIKSLRETILQLAVQGKLTEGWRVNNPNIEPASELLKRIEAEKQQLIAEKKIKKEKTLPPIEDDEMPYELPKGWAWCRLGSLNYNIHYGFTASAKSTFDGVGLLRITDIQNNKVNWLTVPDCDINEKDLPKYQLKENDILIARTGGTIGKSFLIKDIKRKAVFASYLIRAIPATSICSDYLKLFIESPHYWTQLIAGSMGTGQPNVNATTLKALTCPLPPYDEQKAIVEKVNSLMTLCDELEQQIEISQTQIELLMQSCLKEVFEHESN